MVQACVLSALSIAAWDDELWNLEIKRKMNSLLLFLILVSQLAIAFMVNIIARRLENMCDLSKEDVSVKATTEAVKEAKDRLPKQ